MINSFYFFFKTYFLKKFFNFNKFKKQIHLLAFSKNDFNTTNNLVLTNQNFIYFTNFRLRGDIKKLLYIISSLLVLGKNILFIDNDINYNYLPINNSFIFNRRTNRLTKFIKYFDITMVFYLNLKKKKFVFKKLFNCRTINVCLSTQLLPKKFDMTFSVGKNDFYMYIFYLLVVKSYIALKK